MPGNTFKSHHIRKGAGCGDLPKKRDLPTSLTSNRIGQPATKSEGFDDTPPALRTPSASERSRGGLARESSKDSSGYEGRGTGLEPAHQKGYASKAKHACDRPASGAEHTSKTRKCITSKESALTILPATVVTTLSGPGSDLHGRFPNAPLHPLLGRAPTATYFAA